MARHQDSTIRQDFAALDSARMDTFRMEEHETSPQLSLRRFPAHSLSAERAERLLPEVSLEPEILLCQG